MRCYNFDQKQKPWALPASLMCSSQGNVDFAQALGLRAHRTPPFMDTDGHWLGLGAGHTPTGQDPGLHPVLGVRRWVSGGREERLSPMQLTFIMHLLCTSGAAPGVRETGEQERRPACPRRFS